MTKDDLKKWHKLQEQFTNDWHLSANDWQELTRLNYLVMEQTHKIHNTNMINQGNLSKTITNSYK